MNRMVNALMKQYLAMRMHRIERYMQRPEERQERWLRKLLDRARNTEVGQRYRFAEIRSAEEYARRVPVNDYDSIKDDIARMMRGERHVLWPGEINWFAKSSGTTSDKS
ncbi:MAG TPA: GH3 auxin-responsive promoter family protein, partial [Saprospiraceae bacterium]|nr:GH3 auxin-responsive promoter family protein [Saprospiraceae bacterium]